MTIDELGELGLDTMDDDEVRGFLTSHSIGVLGLPTDGAPSMRPMSYGFDGESRLYLLYVLGASSRKEALTGHDGEARFLVYSADTPFNWRSVLLTGTLREVPENEYEAVQESIAPAWRPDLFERARTSLDTKLYEFRIETQSGVKHLGLPPAFERQPSDDA